VVGKACEGGIPRIRHLFEVQPSPVPNFGNTLFEDLTMTYVGIASLIFSTMDIHGYKVPSKSTRGNFMGYDNVLGLCPMIGKAN